MVPGGMGSIGGGGGSYALDNGSEATGRSGDIASYGNQKGNLISFAPEVRNYGQYSTSAGMDWTRWAAIGGAVVAAVVLYKAVK